MFGAFTIDGDEVDGEAQHLVEEEEVPDRKYPLIHLLIGPLYRQSGAVGVLRADYIPPLGESWVVGGDLSLDTHVQDQDTGDDARSY